MKKNHNTQTIKGNQAGRNYCLSGSLVTYQCGRRIFDILVMLFLNTPKRTCPPAGWIICVEIGRLELICFIVVSCTKWAFNVLEILSYMDTRKNLLTFDSISSILLSKQGDYSVVEKVKPDPLNLLANTNVGS